METRSSEINFQEKRYSGLSAAAGHVTNIGYMVFAKGAKGMVFVQSWPISGPAWMLITTGML